MGKYFYFLLVCVFCILISYTGCTKAGSITGSTKTNGTRNLTVTASAATMKVGETATISSKIVNSDGSAISGGGTLGETGSDTIIDVSYASNSNGTMGDTTDTFTLAGSTTTTAPETAGSINFNTTVTATSTGILTVSVTHLDIVASVNITVIASL